MKNNINFLIILTLQIFFSISCNKETSSTKMPDFGISKTEYEVAEDVTSASVKLAVQLSEAYDEIVTLNYSTRDSTAVAGKNYRTVSEGTITINPGEVTKYFYIDIIYDTASKVDTHFKVVFSNPVNAVLTNEVMVVRVINVDYASLAWSDEFTGASLNTAWWNYELGNNNGWGNNELEVYTDQSANVHLDSGYLHITALSGSSYTSGRITTKGKKEFTYGKIVIRAKMPYGKGIWPALWMLGANISEVGWPKCGEIDMMEYLGHETNKVYGTVHWNEGGHKYLGGNTTLATGTFTSDFHVFTLIWTPNKFVWSVDNNQYFKLQRSDISHFPFDLPEFFIFNVAVGGNWPGMPDGTTVFPQHMIMDYIRVYQ